jgi:serine/threonine-protein kinase
MRIHVFASLLVICVFSVGQPPVAHAQSTAEKATAELLFDEGLSLMRSGAFVEACPKLESSQRIDPAVGTLLYLAECYEKQGRTASAWVTFRDAAGLARSLNQLDRANVAEQRAAQLQRQLALVTIQIAPEAQQIAGLRVQCGPVPVDVSLAEVMVPVDPGEVSVEASAPGYAPFTRSLQVEQRGRGTIVIPVLTRLETSSVAAPVSGAVAPAPVVVSEPGTAAVPPQAATADSDARGVPVASLVLGGVGIVGLGVGSYFGIKAMSDADDANELCPDGKCTSQRGEDLMQDARTSATVSNISFAVGIASIATGLVLYLMDPGSESAAADGLVPMAVERGAGLAWKGTL